MKTNTLIPWTVEFDRLNIRRFDLIEKKVMGIITPDEDKELERLQREILTVTRLHCKEKGLAS